MRSTQKQVNKMLDMIKAEHGLKSRADASRYFYGVIAKAFKRHGYSLSYYLDGCFTITKDNMRYYTIPFDELYTPKLTTQWIERNK